MATDATGEVLSFLARRLSEQLPPELESIAAGSGIALSRYAEGITSTEELEGELRALGFSGPRLTNLFLQAQLRRQLDLYRDRLALWRQQVRDGQLTISQLETLLEQAGAGPETVLLERSRAELQRPSLRIDALGLGISILQSTAAPPQRPQEAPLDLGISILQSAAVAQPAPPASVGLALSIVARQPAPPAAAPEDLELSIAINASQEA